MRTAECRWVQLDPTASAAIAWQQGLKSIVSTGQELLFPDIGNT